MITPELKAAVIAEATLLKQHATKDELARLDFEKFEPTDTGHCIYGLITGDCHSTRAVNLLNECTKPYSFSILSYCKPIIEKFEYDVYREFSPIEFYIVHNNANNAALIAFLKDETQTLTL